MCARFHLCVQGFELGSSAAIPDGDGKNRLFGVNGNPGRERGAAIVFAMDVKYIEVAKRAIVSSY